MDREKVIDGLERLRFFNQRAGRELWADKPHDVQEEDIANADAVYADALALLKEQETVEYALEVLRKAGWKETHDVPFPVELLKEHEHGETFTVIDTKTGKEADEYEIALHEDWAKHLCYCDMEGWAIENDGTLLLVDECGRCAYADRERFKVVWNA